MGSFETPAESSGEILGVEALENPLVRRGWTHWRDLCGARRFPDRSQIVLRALGPVLRNVILVRVIEGGADYEYRIVGDAVVQGFDENFAGRRLSAIIADAPKFGLGLRMLYEMVRQTGVPIGYRGRVGADMTGARFVAHENAILPFGPDDDRVDHILVVSVLTMRTQLAR